MYADDPRFAKHCDKFRPSLAEFMRDAIEYFAIQTKSKI